MRRVAIEATTVEGAVGKETIVEKEEATVRSYSGKKRS